MGVGVTQFSVASAGAAAVLAGEAEPLHSRVGHQVDLDRALVDEAKSGSLDAFEGLVRRYQHRVVDYVQAIVRDSGEAEDVAQETFIRAYRSLGRFRGESAFKTWLYTIATNTARTSTLLPQKPIGVGAYPLHPFGRLGRLYLRSPSASCRLGPAETRPWPLQRP